MAAERALAVWENADNWLNCSQVARILHVNQATLSKHIRKGRVASVRLGLGKGIVLIPPAEIVRLAAAYGRVQPETLKRDLARTVVTKIDLTEEELIEGLNKLPEVALLHSPDPTRKQTDHEDNKMRKVRHKGDIHEVDLGRMRPQRAHRDDVPTGSMVRSLESVRPMKRHLVIETRGAKEVDMGRMRPGKKY